ncbi:MAG: hypothetical protein RQ760_21235, partial [Sedimentisphaerales bacterium]|nr:hypothetical protein [Sedimentisphaerales bacterium]
TKATAGLSLNSILDEPPNGGFLEWTHIFILNSFESTKNTCDWCSYTLLSPYARQFDRNLRFIRSFSLTRMLFIWYKYN